MSGLFETFILQNTSKMYRLKILIIIYRTLNDNFDYRWTIIIYIVPKIC